MQIIRYNPSTAPVRRIETGKPVLRFGSSNLIMFNSKAVELLKIDTNTKVEFVQDQQHPKDWYIALSGEGYQLRKTKFTYMMTSKKICDTIRKSIGIDKGYFTLRVCTEPVITSDLIMYGLIMKAQ